ncbi:MAG: DNA polymerase III subunit beta [Polyangiaceae bacterium]
MHVVVSKKDLLRILNRCQGVADKKSTMPVLGNVLLEARAGSIQLSATDLYVAVRGSVKAEVEQPGTIAVGARDLFERVKMMPEGQVSITTSEGAATTIRAVGSARRYTLHGIPGDEFPKLPAPDDAAPSMSLPVDTLHELIAKTHFSISTDETRLHLNSALFEWDGERVRMVTTDGHRLSKMEVSVPGKNATATMLIPNKGIQELKRLCEEARSEKTDEASPELTMTQSGPNAFFSLGGFQFSVKLVDAQFPPYQRVIPEQTERAIRAPKDAVQEALGAVSVAASDRTGGVKLTITEDKIRFESESPESGAGFDEIAVDYRGAEVTVGFNARYFIDVLKVVDDDEVILGISGELDPAVVRPAHEDTTKNHVAVIMPMRI